MALDPHPEGQAQVKRLFIGQTELVCELVDADLLRQRLLLPFIHVVDADTHIRPSILAHHRTEPSEPCPALVSEPPPRVDWISSTDATSTRHRNARSNALRFTAWSRQ
jgi:hypothetical protein